jgi:hypothetical protein
MKQCTVCGASMSEDSIHCANCGAKFERSKTDSVTSKITPTLTFEDTKAGIKIQYPANWNKEIGHDMVIFSPTGENYRDKEDSGLWLMGDLAQYTMVTTVLLKCIN